MASKYILGLTLGLGSVLATPVAVPEPLLGDLIFARNNILLERQDAGTCRNQSCEVATVSGSTGLEVYPYSSYPVGDTQDGDCCIVRYFPAVKAEIYANRPGLQSYCASHGGDAPADANPPGVSTVTVANPPPTATATATKTSSTGLFGIFARASATATATCKPKILIFIKGTFETGDLGNTLGPNIQSGLDANTWDVRGVEYDNSLDNDYCLGLPGGVTARAVLNDAVTQCPNSLIAMSGYSQGAMVVRHTLARAPAAQVAKVKTVVNFGDPFCGAQIGQYHGPIHVFCNDGDGVCNGQLDITLQHLSYFGDVSQAVTILNADTT